MLLRGGDRQVGFGHERFGGDLVGAAEDLVDLKQRVGAGQVAQDQIVELVETRDHGRSGQGEFGQIQAFATENDGDSQFYPLLMGFGSGSCDITADLTTMTVTFEAQ